MYAAKIHRVHDAQTKIYDAQNVKVTPVFEKLFVEFFIVLM